MDVPASSELVIRRFRHADSPRVIWIDALCINQGDDEERASQVSIMDKIYSIGTHNLIWLGEGDETAELAMRCIKGLVSEMKTETNNFRSATTLLYNDGGNIRYSSQGLKLTLAEADIDALTLFYSNEWFQRLWAFLTGLKNARRILGFSDLKIGSYNLPLITRLDNVLTDLRSTKASDPRDHIFGVLGLARKFSRLEEDSPLVRPNYIKSVGRVFCDATLYCIFARKDLSLLNKARHRIGEPGIPGLPSWTPDWSQSWDSETDPSDLPEWSFQADCGERLRMDWLEHSSATQLYVRGLTVTETSTCSSVLRADDLRSLRWMNIQRFVDGVLQDEDTGSLSNNTFDYVAIAMSITGESDYLEARWDAARCSEAAAAYDRVGQTESMPKLRELTVESTRDQRLAAQFDQARFSYLCGRRLFKTRSGCLGVGPQTMAAGDIVAILFGCRMPVVLRKRQAGGNEFEFVGLCYVHGIMDGEAVQEHRAAGKEDTKFILV